MPTEHSKQSLGRLFGGKIASINYNFQTSSQPSSCTLTLVNESNSFANVGLGEEVVIPPFGLPMIAVESEEREDTKKKVLQVELTERSTEILDKEIVLIYGEHTDLQYNLNNDSFVIPKGVFVPRSYYPSNSTFNTAFSFPNLRQSLVKNYGNGVNVIGTARATYSRKYPAQLTGTQFKQPKDSEWITFEGGSLRNDISNFTFSFVYGPNESGDVDLRFGYTLKNLFDLIKSKGLAFDGASSGIMQDTSLFFSESGTIREVLSACLSKIGRSFYIDPFTQRINIVSNSDIARINNNLLQNFENFQSTTSATQISLKKSIKDVESTHFIIKGDLNFSGDNYRNQPDKNQRARKQKFYKLKEDFFERGLSSSDIKLMKIIGPVLYSVDDEETLNHLVYGLFKSRDTLASGELYNKSNSSFEEFEPKVGQGELFKPDWQRSLNEYSEENVNGFFDMARAAGAYRHFSVGDNGEKEPVESPQSVGYYQRVRDFMELWSGTFFSVGMTEREASQRSYIEQAKFIGGELNTFSYDIAHKDDLIAQVPSLQFLFNLLNWANNLSENGVKTDYTVGEIAEFAVRSGDAIGTGDYHVIAKRQLFGGASLDSNDIQRSILRNLFSFTDVNSNKSYLVVTDQAQNYVLSVASDAEKAFTREQRKVKDEMIVKFIKTQEESPSGEVGDASNIGGGEETPTTLFLRNIQSRISKFATRALSIINVPISEAKVFLDNINEINPNFDGPFITTRVSYFRPPKRSDFDIEKGVSNVSVSISEAGIQTDIDYSSRKFAKVDTNFLQDYLGTSTVKPQKRRNPPAWFRNLSRD